jgi:hypothetical protein
MCASRCRLGAGAGLRYEDVQFLLHGSATPLHAERELAFFFDQQVGLGGG